MVNPINGVTKWESLAETLDLKLHEIANGDIFVKSAKGNWFIELKDNGVALFHKNFDGVMDQHVGFRKKYHFQKKFPNVGEALKYIKCHDRTRYTQYEKTERIFLSIA